MKNTLYVDEVIDKVSRIMDNMQTHRPVCRRVGHLVER